MRVYVIHPGAEWSTADVYTGLVAGLRAHPHIDIYEGRIDTILKWYDTALTAGAAQGMFDAAALKTQAFNRQKYASAHITQHILEVWPDVVISVSGHNYHLHDADILRRVGLRTAVILTESPYFGEVEGVIRQHYDVAFTNERRSTQRLQAHYLPHAYNPEVHIVDGPKGAATDALFIGSMFDERRELFLDAPWGDIDFLWRGHDLSDSPKEVIRNGDAAALYRAARVSLNHHRTTTSHGSGHHIKPEEAESLGPRAYEIPACGGFQLMDDSRAEAREVFGDGLATYKAGDSADLVKQVRWWLAHEDMREEWAQAQRDRITPHTWTQRASQVLEALL